METVTFARRRYTFTHAALARSHLGPDLQTILRQSYDYLAIMPTLRSTTDERPIYQRSHTKNATLFLGTIYLRNRKIVVDTIRKWLKTFIREIVARCKSLS